MRDFSQDRLAALWRAGRDQPVFWRHDVDAHPPAALRMALLESEYRIKATYYFTPRSPYYNLFSPDVQAIIGMITDYGHTIGLHAWPVSDRDAKWSDGSVAALVSCEMQLLKQADEIHADPPSRAVSFHVPPDDLLWRDFDTFDSAYASKWKGRYVADSRRRFNYGDPEDRFDGEPLQVNLHPEHWFCPGGDFLQARRTSDRLNFAPYFGEDAWW